MLLDYVAGCLLSCLDVGDVDVLERYVEHLASTGDPWTIGTACSGSEVFVDCLHALDMLPSLMCGLRSHP